MATAKQIAIRLTREDLAIVDAVQAETGHVQTADTFRYVLRQYAKEHGIKIPKQRPDVVSDTSSRTSSPQTAPFPSHLRSEPSRRDQHEQPAVRRRKKK